MIYDIFILNWPSRGCDRLLDDCLGFQIQQETGVVCKFKISHLCFQFMKIIFIWENWPNWLSDGEEGNWGTPWFYSPWHRTVSLAMLVWWWRERTKLNSFKDEIYFFCGSPRICAMSRVVIEEDGRIERGDLEQKVFCRSCALSP